MSVTTVSTYIAHKWQSLCIMSCAPHHDSKARKEQFSDRGAKTAKGTRGGSRSAGSLGNEFKAARW